MASSMRRFDQRYLDRVDRANVINKELARDPVVSPFKDTVMQKIVAEIDYET